MGGVKTTLYLDSVEGNSRQRDKDSQEQRSGRRLKVKVLQGNLNNNIIKSLNVYHCISQNVFISISSVNRNHKPSKYFLQKTSKATKT